MFNCSICFRPSYLGLIAPNRPLSTRRSLSVHRQMSLSLEYLYEQKLTRRLQRHNIMIYIYIYVYIYVCVYKGFKSWIPANAWDERQNPRTTQVTAIHVCPLNRSYIYSCQDLPSLGDGLSARHSAASGVVTF